MKKKIKTIEFQIPEPCSEKWDEMYPLPGGRFCDKCEKTLVDFTDMTDNELVRYFENNNKRVCGRFRPDQLNKKMEIPKKPTSFQKWKAAAAVATGLFAWNSTSAQTTSGETLGIVAPIPPPLKIMELVEQQADKDIPVSFFAKFRGIVKDENGEPLIGASIMLGDAKGTVSDFDGKFELDIPNDWKSFELTFSYIGFETLIKEFEKKDIVGTLAEIRMKESSVGLEEIRVYGYTVNSYQTLTGTLGVVISTGVAEKEPKKEEEEEEQPLLPISDIFPNPFVDFVNVELNIEKEDFYLFHLYNLNGQLIWAKTFDLREGEQSLRLDFSSVRMAAGIHFLRITDGRYEIQTKKIIKVKTKGGEVQSVLPNRS